VVCREPDWYVHVPSLSDWPAAVTREPLRNS
jgi:hypothetical protein